MPTPHSPGFIGRASERSALDRVLGDARRGRSEVLVLRGEAGVGKTALLRYAARQASGFRVLQIAGVQAEMELPYAAIHQLCAPLLADHLDELPVPQKDALRVALGLAAGGVPDRFMVGLAVLGLVAATAEDRPLLCLVEDAQWLDITSSQILGLVARRVLAESVAIVVAIRTGPGDGNFDSLPELVVSGLDDQDAAVLLQQVVSVRLDPGVRDRLVTETHGNPLALLELPRRMTAAELAGGFRLPNTPDLSAHLEDQFADRIRELPEATQQLMLVAAADPLGDAALVWRAGRKLNIEFAALGPAADAELLEIGATVRFRHPLVRSAVYRTAAPGDRQNVHQALADVTDPDADADRRAWHRALAAAGPDEEVAAELERSARRAQSRGGAAASAAFLSRAAKLTPDAARRGRRALAAAGASLLAGAFDDTLALIATAESSELDEGQRAHADLLRAQLVFASNRTHEATRVLVSAARRLESIDPARARDTYADAIFAALASSRLSGDFGLAQVADAARTAPRPAAGAARSADLLLDAGVALAGDYASAVPLCRAAIERLAGDGSLDQNELLRTLWQGAIVALEIWDDESAYILSGRSVQIARSTGTLSDLAHGLRARGPLLAFCGETVAAVNAAAEAAAVYDATSTYSPPYTALVLQAWQGRAPALTAVAVEEALENAEMRNDGAGVAVSHYARAVLGNGHGDYETAFAAAQLAVEGRDVIGENWGLTELVEAATRTGHTFVAHAALERLKLKAAATQSAWALGIAARSGALLSDGAEAEAGFLEAIAQLTRTRVRAELARTQLLYGEWLRRAGRRVESRVTLRAAHDAFTAMGMEAFAERAALELRATGEKVRKRSAETGDELTQQEQQIAQLAREGLSNPVIGARLFLSPRTIEWHLRNVYGKLGISSRRELAAALAAPATRVYGT
jgi:DNA-binding CsgD family transcriptional regulator